MVLSKPTIFWNGVICRRNGVISHRKSVFFWMIFVIFLETECCPVQPHSGHWPCYRTVSIQPIWQFDERQPSGQIEMIQHDSAVLQLKDLRIARKPIPTALASLQLGKRQLILHILHLSRLLAYQVPATVSEKWKLGGICVDAVQCGHLKP